MYTVKLVKGNLSDKIQNSMINAATKKIFGQDFDRGHKSSYSLYARHPLVICLTSCYTVYRKSGNLSDKY